MATYKPIKIKTRFLSVSTRMYDKIRNYVKNPDKDMTRHRKCDLETTISILMTLGSARTKTEILDFFKPVLEKHITHSAFLQQRNKLKAEFFPDFLSEFNKEFPFRKKFKGFHLLAVDGSDINLPTDKNDSTYRVKMTRSDRCYYQAHINAMYDLMEKRYSDITIQPRPKMNENTAFCTMVDRNSFDCNTIFIADRGYASLNNIVHVIQKKQYFLIRSKSPASSGSFIRNLIEPDVETDKKVHLGLTRSHKKQYKKHPDQYKTMKKNVAFDPIPFDDFETVYFIDIRCICLQLENGSFEYLITNLPKRRFSTNDIKELYHLRWGIETAFRTLKYALSLAYLHSRKREYIIQEIYAKVILNNLTALIYDYAQCEYKPRASNKHQYNVAFDNIVAVVKLFLTQNLSRKTLKALLLENTSRVRQDTKNPRNVRSQSSIPFNSRA